jgi:hypothetical protein
MKSSANTSSLTGQTRIPYQVARPRRIGLGAGRDLVVRLICANGTAAELANKFTMKGGRPRRLEKLL